MNSINVDILNNVIMRYKSSAAGAGAPDKPVKIVTPLERVREYFKTECVENETLGEEDAFINDSPESRAERLKQIQSDAERVCHEAILDYDKMINKRSNDIINYVNLGYITSKGNAEVDIANYKLEKDYVNTKYLQPLNNPDADIYAGYKRGFEKGIIKKEK